MNFLRFKPLRSSDVRIQKAYTTVVYWNEEEKQRKLLGKAVIKRQLFLGIIGFFLFLFDAMLFDMLFVWFSYVWIRWKQKSKMPFRWCSEAAQSNAFISSTTHNRREFFFYFYHKNDKTLTIGWILWLLFYILEHINDEKYRIILDTHWMCSVVHITHASSHTNQIIEHTKIKFKWYYLT